VPRRGPWWGSRIEEGRVRPPSGNGGGKERCPYADGKLLENCGKTAASGWDSGGETIYGKGGGQKENFFAKHELASGTTGGVPKKTSQRKSFDLSRKPRKAIGTGLIEPVDW